MLDKNQNKMFALNENTLLDITFKLIYLFGIYTFPYNKPKITLLIKEWSTATSPHIMKTAFKPTNCSQSEDTRMDCH